MISMSKPKSISKEKTIAVKRKIVDYPKGLGTASRTKIQKVAKVLTWEDRIKILSK